MSTIIYVTRDESYQGKFIVIDWYEGFDVIARGVSYEAAIDILHGRVNDTDGECDVGIYRMVYNPCVSGRGQLMEVESF